MHKTPGRAAALSRSARITAVEPEAAGGGLFDRAGATGRLMRSKDWSTTALGPVDRWPESLKTAVRLMLASPAPGFIWWGDDLIHLHNDACARLFGHRSKLGRPAHEIRREIWDAIGDEVCEVLSRNAPLIVRGRRVVVTRNGREHDLYCTFTLTPIRDESGRPVGVLGIGDDDTEAVIVRQRLAALRGLQDLGRAESVEAACEWAVAALVANAREIPFALLYLIAPDGAHATLAGSAGELPQSLDTTIARDEPSGAWLLADPEHRDSMRITRALPPSLADAKNDVDGAAVLRLGPVDGRDACLVVGLSKRTVLDDELRAFLIAAAGLVSSGLTATAQAHPAEPGDDRRNEFLAMLAHELRNPLAPIRSASELLAYVDRNSTTLTHAREIIDRQLGQLVRLVDDLLDASRLNLGTLELKRSPVDVRAAIADAIENVRPLIEEAHHELDVRTPSSAVRVDGDHVRLTQALSNILTNAAQYTEPGGRIGIELRAAANEARVRIADSGIGIDASILPRIFEMFMQGEQRPGEPRHGLGLGLALAKRLVELHGGAIEAHSEGRGKGSEFVVTLPLLRSHRAANRSEINGHDRARRILVADDNTDAATAMAEVLGAVGHDVRTARDGLQALEIAERFRPDLILLDIGMPRLDGYETCKRIRRSPWGRNVAIYAVTGWGQASDRKRTREAGFNAHLVKPVSISTIQELIARSDR